MIFTGNRKAEISYRIFAMEKGRLGSEMSLWAFAQAQRIREESIRNNQIIVMNYELGMVEMDDRFSQIIGR